MSIESKALVTKEELCAHFNLPSVRTVGRLRRARKIPGVKMGYRTFRYDIAAVARALAKLEIREAGEDRK